MSYDKVRVQKQKQKVSEQKLYAVEHPTTKAERVAQIDAPLAGGDGEGRYTRQEAAKRMGINPWQIAHREKKAGIRAQHTNSRGQVLYTEEELQRMSSFVDARTAMGGPNLRDIEVAAKCFDALASGKTPVDLVRMKLVFPHDAETLVAQFSRMSGALLVSTETGKKLAALLDLPAIKDEVQLLSAVALLASRVRNEKGVAVSPPKASTSTAIPKSWSEDP